MSNRTSRGYSDIILWYGICIPIVVFGVFLDRVVKYLALTYVKPKGAVALIKGVIQLTYVENEGAAFSLLSGQRWMFVVLTAAALAFAVYVLVKGHVKSTFGVISLSMVISGALGNFIDRVAEGYVIDMFEPLFVKFAIFNVADILLTVGGIMLACYVLFSPDHSGKKEAPNEQDRS